ncbi:ABC transporter substrate-binding protein [Falsirhodobacter halotolerans]|uniref:ABC transporter substrate-binding protein n=1 Tax=Falsirhodobacter halotolerans TaxID=1146892 RepID=UPI001FD35463|nr:ABC transporter substrate-binding protein [Falsirhodobacter halotolerans]MCJ8140981.1 ABC transporter substrate-binding protein [Falsirhodobacter halotolerans]
MTHKTTNWTRRDDAMVEDAIRRGASRRDLIKMLMASGVAMGAGSSLLLGASRAVAQTPVQGGHLRGAGWSSSTADTLDPAKASLSTDYVRCCAFYNRLTFLEDGGELKMELAESVESDDAKTWQVKLRPGVTFHDGKPLTTADVIYSMRRHLDPAVGSKAAAIAAQMVDFKASDDLTMQIELAAANADLPVILSLHHFMIVADGTTDFSTANGTGAFICDEFQPGIRSIGVRNPNYFKEQMPYLDSFEYFAISDNNARVNAVLSGDVHLAASVNPRSMRTIEGQSQVTSSVTTAGNYTNVNIRLDLSPGDKAGMVEGMKYLMNREVIVNSVLRGLGQIANDQPISPMDRYHNPNLAPRAYDPERARAAFEKAGVLGQEIEIITSDAPNSGIDYAMVVQQAGREAGMNFRVQRVPADGYWSNYWLQSPIHLGNINPRPTPDILFSLLYASDAPWNESQYKSEKFDAMLLEARGLLDDNLRRDIYWEMQEMVANEAGTVIPAYISNVDVLSSKLKGMRPNPLGGQFGYAFAEYVWLED